MPSKSAFSRFIAVLLEVERDVAGLSQMKQQLSDDLVELLPDFGVEVGFDGKALRSHSTGRCTARTGQPSDPDAAWGCHSYFSTDRTGCGLNDNQLRRMIHRSGGTTVVETRRYSCQFSFGWANYRL